MAKGFQYLIALVIFIIYAVVKEYSSPDKGKNVIMKIAVIIVSIIGLILSGEDIIDCAFLFIMINSVADIIKHLKKE